MSKEAEADRHFDRAAEAFTEFLVGRGAETAHEVLEGDGIVHFLRDVAELIECNYPELHAELSKMSANVA